jgi:molybdenum-dependent DNA-binding transcriptional regulator ModE
MYHPTEWPFLISTNPEEAKRRIVEVLKECKGNVSLAAGVLKISQRHIWRMVDKLELEPIIEEFRKEAKSG